MSATICTYNLRGMCRFGKRCRNIHQNPRRLGERQVPNKPVLASQTQNQQEQGACALSPTKSKDKPIENKENICGPSSSSKEIFSVTAIAQSSDKTCGICFDIVLQKTKLSEQKFGILPNCNHCYCLSCIQKWRQSKEFDLEVSKACPTCRVKSDFAYPSKYWIDEQEEKEAFIGKRKQAMKSIDCRYFRKGRGHCPFGNTCLYLHALPNGKVKDVGPPQPRRRVPGTTTADDLVHQILFWLNDDDLDIDTDDEDDDDFDLDLDDPCIAYQYYERGDIRRYLAWERLLRCDEDGPDQADLDLFFM